MHHLSLGKDGEKPRRTGAFSALQNHVAFTTGAGPDTALCLIDATQLEPSVLRLPLKMAEGNCPAGLELVKLRRGNPIAIVFHDHADDITAPNRMSLIELDPNGDGKWTDVRVGPEFDVGKSKIEGHGAITRSPSTAISSGPSSATPEMAHLCCFRSTLASSLPNSKWEVFRPKF